MRTLSKPSCPSLLNLFLFLSALPVVHHIYHHIILLFIIPHLCPPFLFVKDLRFLSYKDVYVLYCLQRCRLCQAEALKCLAVILFQQLTERRGWSKRQKSGGATSDNVAGCIISSQVEQRLDLSVAAKEEVCFVLFLFIFLLRAYFDTIISYIPQFTG